METDQNQNRYENVAGLRITYVRAETRSPDAEWAGSDVIRIQRYKENGGLQRGAEMPVNADNVIELTTAILTLYRGHRQ